MEKSYSLLKVEQLIMRLFFPALLISGGSGFVTYFITEHSVWKQWCFLIHIVSGVLVAVIVIPYVYVHIKRILGNRKLLVLLSGVIATIILVGLTATGLIIAFVWQEQASRWVFEWHIWFSFIFSVSLLLHIVIHCFGIYKNKRNQQIIFQSVPVTTQYFSLISTIAAVVLVFFATILYSWLYSGYIDQAVVQNYQ